MEFHCSYQYFLVFSLCLENSAYILYFEISILGNLIHGPFHPFLSLFFSFGDVLAFEKKTYCLFSGFRVSEILIRCTLLIILFLVL